MKFAQPLPDNLVQRYKTWKSDEYPGNRKRYEVLADEGQHPQVMVISCCDSRVHVTSIFGAETGDFFVHRNIANLVPPYEPNLDYHGTSAAIEYAVGALKVAHIIILGHSKCGGVAECHSICSGNAPQHVEGGGFVARWMDILRPGYDRIKGCGDTTEQLHALEKEGVVVSLENLMTFPFVRDAVQSGKTAIHGVWNDIRNGDVHVYDPVANEFTPI